jgi:hypothetical protein
MSSGTFLLALQRAWAEEWEKMTGASEAARASLAVCWEVWDRSTMIPSRFISRTTVCSTGIVSRPGENIKFSAHSKTVRFFTGVKHIMSLVLFQIKSISLVTAHK